MELKIIQEGHPRKYIAGFEFKREIVDCGDVFLDFDEQVTLKTESGTEFDVTRKNFGYYATPSLNDRLLRFQLRPVLCKNRLNKFFILLVEVGKESIFEIYRTEEKLDVVLWFDDEASLLRMLDIKNDQK